MSVMDVFIAMFVVCVNVCSLELQYVPQRHRQHAFSSGVYHRESLTWAVKLNLFLLGDEDADIAAEAVAADTGLFNLGQISNLDGHFVLSHPYQVGMKRASLSSSTFHDRLRTVSQDECRQITDRVHRILDHHPFVEWYMLQRIVPRFKRTADLMPHFRKLLTVPSSVSAAVHFNDPLYHKQWHLVGIDVFEFASFIRYFAAGHTINF